MSKIHFINELGFTVLIFKINQESLEEEIIAEVENHGQIQADGFVGQEFLVRKLEDNTLGAVVVAA